MMVPIHALQWYRFADTVIYRNPVPFLKLKFGEYLAVQPFNMIY